MRALGVEAVAQRGEIARAAAVDRQPRQRAQEIGRRGERLAQRVAQRRRLDEKGDGVEPFVDRRADRSSGLASRSAISRAPAGVAVRSMVAISEPARSPASVRVSSRLARVAASISSPAPRARRAGQLEPRQRVDLGALEIAERQRRGGDLGAAERAEPLQRVDAVEVLDQPRRRSGVERLARQRRRRDAASPRSAARRRDRRTSACGATISLGSIARDLRPEARLVGLRRG